MSGLVGHCGLLLKKTSVVVGQAWNSADMSANLSLDGTALVVTRGAAADAYSGVRAIQSISGKLYWEVVLNNTTAPGQHIVGVMGSSHTLSSYVGNGANGWGYAQSEGALYNNASQPIAPGGLPTATAGDVIMFALDSATGKFWVGKNGTWMQSGNPGAGTGQQATTTGTLFPGAAMYHSGMQETAHFTTGTTTYTVPSGFSTF